MRAFAPGAITIWSEVLSLRTGPEEENMNKKNRIKILLVVLIVVVAGIVYSCTAAKSKPAKEESAVILEEESQSENFSSKNSSEKCSEAASEQSAVEEICVHVCGCVRTPGVYYLPKGARVHDAIEEAGGMTEAADSQYVNLAKEAEDGVQIYIPSLEETAEGSLPRTEEATETADGLVNINTASVDELKTLPGIGTVKAEAIIAYRESNGTFGSIEEIMNVAGIKENAYEKIKEHIRV